MIDTIYNKRDNKIKWKILKNKQPIDLSTVTKFVLDFDGFTVDSSVSLPLRPNSFIWNTIDLEKEELVMELGHENIPVKDYNVRVILFDPTYDDGLVLGTKVIRVVD